MLTTCRSLLANSRAILVEDPTERLSPMIEHHLMEPIQEIHRCGVSGLLVEHKLTTAVQIADKVYVMVHGRIVNEGTPAELRENERVRKEWLEVA